MDRQNSLPPGLETHFLWNQQLQEKPRIGQHQAAYVDIPSKLLQFKNNMNEVSNFKTHQNTPDNMQSNFNS